LRSLERQAAALSGDLSEYQGDIARAAQSIGETRLQILNLSKQRAEQVAGELRDAQNRIADLQERVRSAEDILQRRDIVAPVAGSVINLATVTPGGVVAPGAKLLELVPEDDAVVIDAQIRTTDIDTVRPGQPAEVHLVAYKQRTTPMLLARLTYVSGDSVLDERTGASYFRARVEVPPDELERMKDYSLLPGMPVQVMVLTGERTFLDYLIEPLHDSFTRAFREE
jgi:HlyD family type I secretion membrane fusion protein